MTDQDIVNLYWQRSDRAVPETDRVYGSYCHTVAYNLLRSPEDAEECVNDTWLAAWNAMPPARPNSLRAFLAKLTRNIAVTRLRRRGSLKRGGGAASVALEELEECLPGSFDLERTVEARELCRCIDRFLSGLPERERTIFVGRYFYVLTPEELAERVNMKSAGVKTVLYRTRAKLLKELEKEGILNERGRISV
jgi:RNA polymerase sigma-70 factor (ECF subfamily)